MKPTGQVMSLNRFFSEKNPISTDGHVSSTMGPPVAMNGCPNKLLPDFPQRWPRIEHTWPTMDSIKLTWSSVRCNEVSVRAHITGVDRHCKVLVIISHWPFRAFERCKILRGKFWKRNLTARSFISPAISSYQNPPHNFTQLNKSGNYLVVNVKIFKFMIKWLSKKTFGGKQ